MHVVPSACWTAGHRKPINRTRPAAHYYHLRQPNLPAANDQAGLQTPQLGPRVRAVAHWPRLWTTSKNDSKQRTAEWRGNGVSTLTCKDRELTKFQTQNKLYQIYFTVPPQSTLPPSFQRVDQILYNKLRIEHTRLTHSYLIDHTVPPECNF